MGKKYVPSGYQIIDLGEHNLSSTLVINKGDNADADILMDLYSRGKLWDKPILLKIKDTSENKRYMGFASLYEEFVELYIQGNKRIDCLVSATSLEIDRT